MYSFSSDVEISCWERQNENLCRIKQPSGFQPTAPIPEGQGEVKLLEHKAAALTSNSPKFCTGPFSQMALKILRAL